MKKNPEFYLILACMKHLKKSPKKLLVALTLWENNVKLELESNSVTEILKQSLWRSQMASRRKESISYIKMHLPVP